MSANAARPTPTPPPRRGPRRGAELGSRVAQYLLGLAGMGVGLAVMLEAGVGVGPWAVFHDGIARVTPLSFGGALVVVGVVVLVAAWAWTGERPGPGTFVNMAAVGPIVDLVRASGWTPQPEAWPVGIAQFLLGTVIIGAGQGLYITARFGAGPRDGFTLGLARIAGLSVRRTRTLLEIAVLVIGVLLGGSVGVGTVIFAFAIGPAMQTSIRLFERPVPAPAAAAGD